MGYFIAKSETIAWASGGKKNVPLDFVSRLGIRSGRHVIEKALIVSTLNITTPAAVTILGADMAGFVKKLRIHDVIGNRVYLTGAKLRVMAHHDMGALVPVDPTTHPAATAQDDVFYHWVHFSQEQNARRRYDTAFPVDDLLQGGGFEIEMPTAADIYQTGAGGSTINSGTYVIYLFMREEWDVEFHCRDVREEFNTDANSVFKVPVNGRLIRGMFAYKEAGGGGTATTTITDITIEKYGIVSAERKALKQAYLARGQVRETQDPFFNDKALAIIWPRADAKLSDYLNISGQLFIRLTSTMATPDIIAHFIAPRDERMMRNGAVLNDVSGANLTVKTAGKSLNQPAQWGRLAQFMPIKTGRTQG